MHVVLGWMVNAEVVGEAVDEQQPVPLEVLLIFIKVLPTPKKRSKVETAKTKTNVHCGV